MKLQLIFAALTVVLVHASAHAKTYYFVNGKQATLIEARKAGANDKVIKIQASTVSLNQETGNLKKSGDVEFADVQKLSAK